MINKNVYILYPAGYHGSYLKWAIESSDLDSRKNTVLDPINKDSSYKFGGSGTAHANIRVPTHQSFISHQRWVILNQPTRPNVYVIYTTSGDVINCMVDLLFEDPSGIIISLHNDNNANIDSYGKINCVTKWPTYIDSVFKSVARNDLTIKSAAENFLKNGFDASQCSDNRKFRNFLVNHSTVLGSQEKINFENLQYQIDIVQDWFLARNFTQPHEVNSSTYIPKIDNVKERIFQINCKEIPDAKFLNIFNDLMIKSEISDNWDLSSLQNIHHSYVNVQPNLQWFESVSCWEDSGRLDDYLTSHVVIESEIIQRIFKKSNIPTFNHFEQARWLTFYANVCDPSWWPAAPATELGFYNLPKCIQDEIKYKFNYQLKCNNPPVDAILNLNWEDASLSEINKVFQSLGV